MRNLLIVAVSTIVLASCVGKEEEIKLVSGIDGEEYYKNLESELDSRIATSVVLEKLERELTYTDKVSIADSIGCTDQDWRIKHFKACDLLLQEFADKELAYIGDRTLVYFLTQPSEFVNTLDTAIVDNQMQWIDILSQALQRQIGAGVTDVQAKNMAIDFCVECTDEQIEDLLLFIDVLVANR